MVYLETVKVPPQNTKYANHIAGTHFVNLRSTVFRARKCVHMNLRRVAYNSRATGDSEEKCVYKCISRVYSKKCLMN